MEIHFFKYHGTGNDFIILDNRDSRYASLTSMQIAQLCDRRTGIGADGLMLLELESGFDFRMQYYNADGKIGSMCGNGGRCLVAFAYMLGIQQQHYHFIASDGPHHAERLDDGRIRLQMTDVRGIAKQEGGYVLDTGSPHYVEFVELLNELDVVKAGRAIRNSPPFSKNGINVNFVLRTQSGIRIRTYERGVEDETYSCGTGATACAIVSSNQLGTQVVTVGVRGGELQVEFTRNSEQSISNIWLIGPAAFVYSGTVKAYV